jgi:hypothetical protein
MEDEEEAEDDERERRDRGAGVADAVVDDGRETRRARVSHDAAKLNLASILARRGRASYEDGRCVTPARGRLRSSS